jgi:hypothetical protein
MRAAEKARQVLDAAAVPVIAEDVRRRIVDEIPGLEAFVMK